MTYEILGSRVYDEMSIIRIAKICHEVNRSYCEAIGDKSQPTWDAAPDWQRASACQGVRFHLNNPDATPKDSHEEWVRGKKAAGWTFARVKDADKKQHPCMIPYMSLPLDQRVKDFLFIATVHAAKAEW